MEDLTLDEQEIHPYEGADTETDPQDPTQEGATDAETPIIYYSLHKTEGISQIPGRKRSVVLQLEHIV